LTTALEGSEGSASRPGRSLLPGKTRYPLYRRRGGPQGLSGQLQKISPPTGIRSPNRPDCSQSLYRLRYRAHSFVFAFHCNYHKAIPSIRQYLSVQATMPTHSTEHRINTFFGITATLNASTRNVSRVSSQGAQIPGSRSLRRMNFVPWRVISVGPLFRPCLLSPLWLQERSGGTQIFLENLCNHVSDCPLPRRPCCVCPPFHIFQFNLNQLSDFDQTRRTLRCHGHLNAYVVVPGMSNM
jgi:hypothetical protein